MMEYTFAKTDSSIEHDKVIKNFFYKPSSSARKLINQRFDALYLTGPMNKYNSRVYLFDADFNGLFNRDTVDYNSLFREKAEASSTNYSSNLYYKESVHEGHSYLSYIPIYSDTINTRIGYVVIGLEPKKQVAENVTNELLQPTTNIAENEENDYAYAIYVGGKLVSQNNDHPFPNYLKVVE